MTKWMQRREAGEMGQAARFPKSGTLRVTWAYDNFETGVGGRAELIDLLEYSGGRPR